MQHNPDCGRGPHCECDPMEDDEYDEPNDGYDHDTIYEMAANIEMAKAFQPSRASEVAAQLAAAQLVDPCINPNDCCGYCQSDDVFRATRERVAAIESQIDASSVPTTYEPTSPRYAIAYWLASLVGELTSAELAASDCMDDADELLAELLAAGLTVVPTDSDVVRDWRNGECFDPECRGGWIWVDIDNDGESIRQRCPQCEAASRSDAADPEEGR